MDVAITLMMFYLDEVVRIFDTGHVSQKVLDAELLRVWLSARYSEDYVDVSEISRCGPGKGLECRMGYRRIESVDFVNGWFIERPTG